MAVFIPRQPTGVIRCAASPTRKPAPCRYAVATSAVMVNQVTVSVSGCKLCLRGGECSQILVRPVRVAV